MRSEISVLLVRLPRNEKKYNFLKNLYEKKKGRGQAKLGGLSNPTTCADNWDAYCKESKITRILLTNAAFHVKSGLF